MSNKSICDKCGCEVPIAKTDDWGVTTKNTLMLTMREESNKERKNYDLCDDCVKRFEAWLAEKSTAANIRFFRVVNGQVVEDVLNPVWNGNDQRIGRKVDYGYR